jgi:hypothetical protein
MTVCWSGMRSALSTTIVARRGQCTCAVGQSRCDGWVRASMMDGGASRSEWPFFRRGCWADLLHAGGDCQWHAAGGRFGSERGVAKLA